ncbi:MAG: hypothetical protein NVSMB51_10090 [Solirubrobacteraceae bacterium]
MGLLDDAIREHLELRRRLGADPGEVARMEQEALGPVVRGEAPASPVLPDAEHEASPAAGDAQQLDIHDALEDPAPVAEHDASPAAAGEPGNAEAPGSLSPQDELGYVPPAGVGEETVEFDVEAGHLAEQAPAAAPETSPAPRSAPAHEPSEEQHGGHSTAPEETARPAPKDMPTEQAAGEDVLEQTPEFLQETPEHDRLWFEQAPPKDFDFDK